MPIAASVILISACQDDQFAHDLGHQGLFTLHFLKVWEAGSFAGSHRSFHAKIHAAVRAQAARQEPNHATAGEPNAAFEDAAPFRAHAPGR